MKRFRILWVLGCLLVLGCSGPDATVGGRVTFEGEALTSGTVIFKPVAGGATGYSEIEVDGTYEIRTGSAAGLVPGEYVVMVDGTEPPMTDELVRTESGELMESTGSNTLPDVYLDPDRSPLKATVKSGHQIVNLPLVREP